ncbi:MAG: tetratricopeptide repeat protein [Pyrinomonadaceae bacterium]
MSRTNCFLVCVALLFGLAIETEAQTFTPVSVDAAEAARWREDLRFLAQEMPRVHRNLFHTMKPVQFEAAIKRLDERIPTLGRHQIIVEMERIVAMVGDGHTNISPTRDPKIGFHTLPIKFYWFKDGWYIRAATREHAELIGARVLKIGNVPMVQAYAKARDLIGRDNEMDAKFFAPQLMVMPEVLQALGLSDNTVAGHFTVEQAGKERDIVLAPYGPAEMMPSDTDATWVMKPEWMDARDIQPSAKSALWLRDPLNKFWFQYLADSKTLYVQLNQVGNKDDETLAMFAGRLSSFMETNPVDRLVLDLRLNRGGNGGLNRPLLVALIKSKLDQPGKFFTLIGRSTFSAAQFLINDLEKYSNTIFIGEPSGGKVNSYGDSKKIMLPNSGITVRVSTLWWQEDERDHRQWTAPLIAAELAFADYRAGVDPALNAAIGYVAKKPLGRSLREAMAAGTLAVRYREWKADPANASVDTESILIDLGYELLGAKKFAAAIEVFQLNVADASNSANAFDSLGEAYAAAGNRELAIKSYERALEIDPKLASAIEALKKLRGK